MLLTNLKIEKSKPKNRSYKLSDGDGLLIVVQPNGKKYWRLKYHFGPREKTLSIGAYPAVSLAEARQKRSEAKDLLRRNIDPSLEKQSLRIAAVTQAENTFGSIAWEWYENNCHSWTDKHAKKLWRRLEIHIIPYLGKRPIAEILPRELLSVLKNVQSKGATEMTHRLLWICSRVFKYAVVIGATDNNPALNLSEGLKPHRTKNLPVISERELPAFLSSFRSVRARPQTKIAFQLLLLTALRTGELRHCKWNDVSFADAQIRVRKEVMKMRDEHIVPLSHQALNLLQELRTLSGHQEWLFPNPYRQAHPVISENAINVLIERMGYKGLIVGHSFRSLFSTILNEHDWPSDAIERQLSHTERNTVRAAYNRAQHMTTRRQMMQWWADHLDSLACVEALHAAVNVRHTPSRSTHPNFDGRRILPCFDPAEPSALTHWN